MSRQQIPRANSQYLRLPNNSQGELIKIGSDPWFEWLELEDTRSFSFEDANGHFTARKEEKQRGGAYWYAYRWIGKTTKAYLGASSKLTREKLNQTAVKLSRLQIERKSQMSKSRVGKVPVPP